MFKTFVFKALKMIFQHKIIMVIIAIMLIGGGYFGYKKFNNKTEQTSYILATVEKGALIASVSGSGQVSALDQVDVKPKISGEISALYISKDQEVKAGSLIVELDSEDAKQAIQDAEINLENTNFALEELEKSKGKAETDLVKNYEDTLNIVSDNFNELSTVMEKLEKMFLESSYGGDQSDIDYYRSLVSISTGESLLSRKEEENYFIALRDKYNEVKKEYFLITKLSSPDTLENFFEKVRAIEKEITELTRLTRDAVILCKELSKEQSLTLPIPTSTTDTQLSDLNSFTNSLTQQMTNLLSNIQAIDEGKDTIESYKRDIQSQQILVEQKESALSDAKEYLADCFVRAPFDGIIVALNSKKEDSVTSGTILATIITEQQLAEISLNEIDIAKIKVGQKVTFTFDAVSDLSITGEVIEIDNIGTVSQGVVNYSVKIIFDTQDERIRPGMSLSANIITNAKQNVLLVPSSAIKTNNSNSYIEILESSAVSTTTNTRVISKALPRQQQVEIGLSNDSYTEIISGLKEGDTIISQTITSNPNQTSQQNTQSRQNQGFGMFGM